MMMKQKVNRNVNHQHWWLIDRDNVGICKYCGEVKDFGVLLRAEKFMRDVYLYQVNQEAGSRGGKRRHKKEVLAVLDIGGENGRA